MTLTRKGYENCVNVIIKVFSNGLVNLNIVNHKFNNLYKNKVVYFCSYEGHPYYEIFNRAYYTSLYGGEKLFVDPKSGISRDVLRNSGYSITIDKERAYCIVIPSPDMKTMESKQAYAFAAKNNDDTLYCINVYDALDHTKGELDDRIKAIVQRQIDSIIPEEERDFVFYSNEHFNSVTAYFLPNVESYYEILGYSDKKFDRYIIDSMIPIKATVDIDVETLILWTGATGQIAEKNIMNSNWRKYPFTMCYFIHNYQAWLNASSNYNTKMMLSRICYQEYLQKRYGREVQPEDWNLLQRFLLAKAGLGNELKGFVNYDRELLDSALLRKKIAVSGFLIDKPENAQVLIDKVNSCE